MNVIRTEIEDVLILEPRVFGDDRGFFYESFNQSAFEHILGYPVSFVQDNHSRSSKNVLRGLHFQRGEYGTHGAVFDVAVDIRPNSVSFGKWVGVLLSADNKQQLWIPKGFAHGFLVLSDIAEFQYKTTNYYHPESDCGICWNDERIAIDWPQTSGLILSPKDERLFTLDELIRLKLIA
ncbi:TPA: dTDP-4-dehydrorhamnose 3,5-epimerase [Escherichia coli]